MNNRYVPQSFFARTFVWVALATAALVGIVLAIIPAFGIGPSDSKQDNPFATLSKEDRQAAERAVGADLAAKQGAFAENFIQTGADLHSLPTADIHRLVTSSSSLQEAAMAATVIVRGTVVSQRVDRKNARVVSQVNVAEVVSGKLVAKTVSLTQVGGPQLNGDKAVLVQTSDDPILWVGREYVLLLGPCEGPTEADQYCATGGGRQFEVSGASVIPVEHEGWAGALARITALELTDQLKAGRAAKP